MGLLDDISKLTKPATELPDLEDDNFESSSLTKPSENRQKRAQNFNFEEGKYAGSAISRKEIFGDISEISGLHGKDSGDSENDDEEEEDVDSDDVEMGAKDSDDEKEDVEDSEGDEDVDDEEEEALEDEEEGDEEKEEDSGLKMTTLSLKDDSDKADKATSVRHQRQVWDDLMYSNIRIHALLNTMNQMPRGESRKNLLKNCDDSTKKSLEIAMENMAKLRDLMKNAIGNFDEKSAKNGGISDDDDEEIPSDDEEILSDFDDEEEEEEESEEKEDVGIQKNSAGTSLKSLKKNLETLDNSIEKFRSTTVTKWYNRTKILNSSTKSTDFSVFEKGSILGQINKVLADEDKLLKKVHTNRSGKSRIGAPTPSSDVIDNEIFDDSDFYQVLLKQMLESRNQTNTQDGADMTRSYMELQTMFNNKKKRDVSQLSSKDRRLKYEPIAKLINFYPSKPSVATWSHESRNELFKSLFS